MRYCALCRRRIDDVATAPEHGSCRGLGEMMSDSEDNDDGSEEEGQLENLSDSEIDDTADDETRVPKKRRLDDESHIVSRHS